MRPQIRITGLQVCKLVLAIATLLASSASPASEYIENGYLEVGKHKVEQSASWWLCFPGRPESAQDQTSGLLVTSAFARLPTPLAKAKFLSVGDDSGLIFAFNLTEKYIANMQSFRVAGWRNNIDLEDITLIPQTGQIAVTLEHGDTKVRIMSFEDGKLIRDLDINLALPPGYKKKSNIGPEGLAFSENGNLLIVAWEGGGWLFPKPRPYLSIYKLFVGEGKVTGYKFIKHILLPKRIQSASAILYLKGLSTLLILDRNSEALFALIGFSPESVLRIENPQYCFTNIIEMKFHFLKDPFGRQFRYYSFEGMQIDTDGTLYVVTDPWRSRSFETYRPIRQNPDVYYKNYVPMMFSFNGFLNALILEISSL